MAYYSYSITTSGPTNPPIPKKRLIIWIQQSWSLPINSQKMQRLLKMLSMQLEPAAMNIVTKRLKKLRLQELAMREQPHIAIRTTQMEWYLNFLVRALTSCPPAMQPRALARKMKEQQVQSYPVILLKKMMMGPTPETTDPQRVQTTAQTMK